MSDSLIPVQAPPVTSQNLDAEQVTVGGNPVQRERMQIAGAAAAEIARVENSTPGGSDYGVVVRHAGTATVDSELPAAAALGDAVANPTAPQVGAAMEEWDPKNSQWERLTGNFELSLLTSAARTTTQTLADQTNRNCRGVLLILDVTAWTAGSLTVDIQGKDPVSGKYVSLLTGAAVVSVSTNVYRVYPSLTAAANLVANEHLWRTWRVVVTVGDATSITYSLGAVLLI